MEGMKQPRRIVIFVDRLVLKGVAPHDARALSAALRASLREALVQHGIPASASVSLPSVPRARIEVAGDGAAVGGAAGQAIHRSIGQGLSGRRV